jgi:hypothetical protein
MFLLYLKTYWKQIVVITLITICSYLVYNKIYSIGYTAASFKCEERFKDYNSKLDTHIKTLEEASSKLASSNLEYKGKVEKGIKDIISAKANQPTTVIVNGECKPSTEFTNTFNEVVKKANE